MAVVGAPRHRERALLVGPEVHRHLLNALLREEDAVALAVGMGRQLEVRVVDGAHLLRAARLRTVELDHRKVFLALLARGEEVHQRVVHLVAAEVRIGSRGGQRHRAVVEGDFLIVILGQHEEALVRVQRGRRKHRVVGSSDIARHVVVALGDVDPV